MKEFLATLDWDLIIKAIWTLFLVPCLGLLKSKVDEWAKQNKIESYVHMLETSAYHVVRDLQDTVVKEIKGTDEWTEEKIDEISQLALDKTIEGLTNEAYQFLLTVNADFYDYVNTVIKSKLYELKQEEK